MGLVSSRSSSLVSGNKRGQNSTVMTTKYPAATVHRGLENKGANNCFLNVTIQALWHLGPFRIELQKLLKEGDVNNNSDKSTMMTAIGNLFVQYEFSELSVLPPTELRILLSSLSEEFGIGAMADANEALSIILNKIHEDYVETCPSTKKCLAHHVLGGAILEQSICGLCGATSEPELRNDFMYCVLASEAIKASHKTEGTTATNQRCATSSSSFGKIINMCMDYGARRCPSATRSTCRDTATATVKSYSLEPPLSLALSVGWAQDQQCSELIREFLSLVSYTISLSDLFIVEETKGKVENKNRLNGPAQSSPAAISSGPSYVFRGLVCYYGMHYVSIFQEYRPGEPRFLLFDDHNVRPLGGWREVKEECVKASYQPVLLLYELEGEGETSAGIQTRAGATSSASSDVWSQYHTQLEQPPTQAISGNNISPRLLVSEAKTKPFSIASSIYSMPGPRWSPLGADLHADVDSHTKAIRSSSRQGINNGDGDSLRNKSAVVGDEDTRSFGNINLSPRQEEQSSSGDAELPITTTRRRHNALSSSDKPAQLQGAQDGKTVNSTSSRKNTGSLYPFSISPRSSTLGQFFDLAPHLRRSSTQEFALKYDRMDEELRRFGRNNFSSNVTSGRTDTLLSNRPWMMRRITTEESLLLVPDSFYCDHADNQTPPPHPPRTNSGLSSSSSYQFQSSSSIFKKDNEAQSSTFGRTTVNSKHQTMTPALRSPSEELAFIKNDDVYFDTQPKDVLAPNEGTMDVTLGSSTATLSAIAGDVVGSTVSAATHTVGEKIIFPKRKNNNMLHEALQHPLAPEVAVDDKKINVNNNFSNNSGTNRTEIAIASPSSESQKCISSSSISSSDDFMSVGIIQQYPYTTLVSLVPDTILGELPRTKLDDSAEMVPIGYSFGIELDEDHNDGRLVVVNFTRDPITYGMLSAERSGEVALLDRVLEVSFRGSTVEQPWEIARAIDICESAGYSISLLLQSAYRTTATVKCPSCRTAIAVDAESEHRVRTSETNQLSIFCSLCRQWFTGQLSSA